ncbi:hypothetical protein BH11PSE11_BH11PSE11_04690 [soil metagenome]
MHYLFPGLFVALAVGLDLFASWRLIRYDGFEARQKWLVAALVWLLPLLVAILVIAVTNKTQDKASGRYRNKRKQEMPDLSDSDAGAASGAADGGGD